MPRNLVRSLPFVAVLLIAATAPLQAEAQEGSADVALGHALLFDRDIEQRFPVGWFVAIAGGSARVAAVAEATGSYRSIARTTARSSVESSLRVHSLLGGPRFSFGNERITASTQVLIGVARASAHLGGISNGATVSLGGSAIGFAVQPGAAIDVMLSRRLGVRTAAGLRIIRSKETTGTELQVLTGLVIRLAGR